ncbi:hypothetical protein [Microbacterium oxydans]|uniref:hypothetical protein n=1 Tax=Microbacterium oxydans TaxID=82380 RepID=UPI00226B0447|nr:hypothetical protein [Microbacterium oxydans]WAA66671.1 hypothetical protein MME74_02690 [Microbacterium oxydans]
MRRSILPARLITILIAVVVTPFAVGLIATGGSTWVFTYAQYAMAEVDTFRFAMPIVLQVVGVLLLLLVVLTGIWSSAGLIAVGVLALFPLACALFPPLVLETFRLGPGVLPREWVEGLAYGLPLFLLPVLGTMGVVLAIVRRRPARPGPGPVIVGAIAAPVLLLTGALLASWGLGHGRLIAYQQDGGGLIPEAAVGVLLGTLLIVAGILATRWSAFALLLPALAALVASVLVFVPTVFLRLFSALPMQGTHTLLTLVLLGAGTATALIYVTFTFVLVRVRRQASSPAVGAGHMPPSAYPAPSAAAPQPYPFSQPQPHPGAGSPEPGTAPFPPAPPVLPYPPTAAPPAPPPAPLPTPPSSPPASGS